MIRELRTKKFGSREEFHEALGGALSPVSLKTLQNIELGKSNVFHSKIHDIAKALGVTYESLLADDARELKADESPSEVAKNGEVATDVILDDGDTRRHSKHREWTDAVKRALKERSLGLLNSVDHQESILSRKKAIDPSGSAFDDREMLSKDAIDAILSGNAGSGKDCIVIFGNSGLGKTMLLVRAEHLVSSGLGNRFPVRLGSGPRRVRSMNDHFEGEANDGSEIHLPPLTYYKWDSDRLLEELAAEMLQDLELRDADDQIINWTLPEQTDWLRRGLEEGEAVLLLDSLDQTDGPLKELRRFLKRFCRCSVVATGRPETKHTKSEFFDFLTYEALQIEEFGQDQINRFCGAELADFLLSDSKFAAFVKIPVLLNQLRALHRSGNLDDLKNRESIYDATLEMLFEHARQRMRDAGYDYSIVDRGMIERHYSRIAWETLQAGPSGSLSGVWVGDKQWHGIDDREKLKQLLQFNLIVRQTYIEVYGAKSKTQYAWRHLSFCEWFAGLHLASLSPDDQQEFLFKNACDPSRAQIIQFALSYAERLGRLDVLNHLAESLLACGLPFLLWQCIAEDKVEIDARLGRFCRWLVHCDAYGAKAWTGESTLPEVDERSSRILSTMFQRENRDSRWLHAAWRLVATGSNSDNETVRSRCEGIRNIFLGEFSEMVSKATEQACGMDRSQWSVKFPVLTLVADEELIALGLLAEEKLDAIRTWHQTEIGEDAYRFARDALQAHQKKIGTNYCLCPPINWIHPDPNHSDVMTFAYGERNSTVIETISERFWMGRTAVQNVQFECMDPQHFGVREHRWATVHDDLSLHPVVNVSWYQAKMFCIWLNGRHDDEVFDLPDEVQWEFACRAGQDGARDEFGIPIKDASGREQYDKVDRISCDFINFYGNYLSVAASKSRPHHTTIIAGTDQYPSNSFGLSEMHGQVREWCASIGNNDDELCDVRGGAWADDAWYCRAAFSRALPRVHRSSAVGFRLVRLCKCRTK